MVDDNHSLPPSSDDESARASDKGAEPPKSTKPGAGWHEPAPTDDDSRPIAVDAWYAPPGASEIPATPAAEQAADDVDLPSSTPQNTGDWFSPLDSQLDDLLAGAADTIHEIHAPEPARTADDTHPQTAGDTQAQPGMSYEPSPAVWEPPQPAAAQIEPEPTSPEPEPAAVDEVENQPETVHLEPAAAIDSTPVAEGTPVQTGLSPAEAALLAEQRAAQEQAPMSQPPSGNDDSLVGDTSQPVRPGQTPQASGQVPPAPAPSQFEQVEQKVGVLRQQFEAGQITRDQLQAELRKMMILDDDGRWWMLGLETNRWYYFSGQDWVAENPPGYEERVRGSAVRTETGMQEVIDDQADPQIPQRPSAAAQIEIDDDGMPLPRQVPQEDPGATLVSAHAAFIEPVRPSDAPTQIRSQQVESDAASTIEHPARADAAPVEQDAYAVGSEDLTLQSDAVAGSTPPPIPTPVTPAQYRDREPIGADQLEKVINYRIGEFPQPDYSAALGVDRNRNTYIKWAVRAVVIGVIGGMFLTLLVLLGMIGYYLYEVNQYSDAVASLTERTANFETTIIYDANGVQMAEFSDPNTGLRTEVPLDEISPWLIHATVSTENETFYTDPGFSILAIVRATYQNIREGGTVSGASTITQQLARALVLETEFASQRTTERKIVEIIVASEIKRKYEKNEILEIYLNEIFYGNFAYGIEAAASTYFNKTAAELNPAEAAFLAGLPQSPATYDPVVNREAALQRMKSVLRLMAEANGTGCIYIQHNDTTPWGIINGQGLCVKAEERANGEIVYFYKTPNMEAWEDMTLDIARVEIAAFKRPETDYAHPHYVNYVWQQLEEEFGPQRIYSAGFRVTTTLDENIQAAAEQAVTDGLASVQARGYSANNASVVVIRPADGAVLGMVGSADFYNEQIKGQVNVAFTGQQPGSSIKPFVYLTAFQPDELGRYLTPASILWDVETTYGGNYTPLNYDRQYHGPQTVREALGNSYNVPAVKALDFVSLERFTEVADNVGITFPLGDPVSRGAGLQTALGGVEVRLFDMVAVYAMLANNGVKVQPYAIVSITDSDGNPIMPPGIATPEQVVAPEYAYLITSILSDRDARATEFGYNTALDLSGGRLAAVKTGTSNDGIDVWTLGYTPQYAVGVWVGNTENELTNDLTGFYGAAPIWHDVMEAAHAGTTPVDFVQPTTIQSAEVCDDSGVQAYPNCSGRTHWDIFAASAPPPGPQQDIFVTLQVDGYTGKLVNEYCNDDVETKTFLNIDDEAAINWLNNNPAGQQWLSSRGYQAPMLPIEFAQEYCAPNEQRPLVTITTPPSNAIVEGTVTINGTISMPNFSRYEIRYGISHDPQAFSEPLDVQTVQHPNPNEYLGQFNTTSLENGPYTIRIVVIDSTGRDVIRDIPITVNNAAPTPVPAPQITVTPAPSITPIPGGAGDQPGGPTATFTVTPVPTWTLTPTPQ